MAGAPVAIIMGSQSDWATHAPCRRDARRARDRLRGPHRLGPPHARPARRLRQGRQGGRLQGHHRRRRRRRPPARHDGGADAAAGLRRPGRIARPSPARTASSRSCRCRPASRSARSRSAAPARSTRRCSPPPSWRSPIRPSPSASTPGGPGRPTASPSARSTRRLSAMSMPRRHPRHPRRRPARPHAGARGGPARPQGPCLSRRTRTARPSTSPPRRTMRALRRRGGARLASPRRVDVVTYEFENVPAHTREILRSRTRRLRPSPRALATTQDRLAEKTFVAGLGIPTAPFAAVADEAGPRRRRSRRSAGPPC